MLRLAQVGLPPWLCFLLCFPRASIRELSRVCVRLHWNLAREPRAVQCVLGDQSDGWGAAMPQGVSVFGPRE